MRKSAAMLVLVVAFAANLWAQAQQREGKAAEGQIVVLKAARLFDGKSNTVVTPGMVVVTGKQLRPQAQMRGAQRSGSD